MLPAGTAIGALGGLHRLARPQALQDQRRLAGIGRRADPGVDAEIRGRRSRPASRTRRATRFMRSPPATKNVAITSTSTSARSAIGSRAATRGIGTSGPQRPGASAARARYARARARRAWPSSVSPAILSEIVVAGRCVSPELRSSRRSFSVRLGSRTRSSGSSAAARDQAEHAEPDGAADRRQPQPQPEPGQRQEQADGGRDRGQRRPQPLPQDASSGPG